MIFIIISIQLIAILVLMRNIQENNIKLEKENYDKIKIKEINQRKVIIFLLSEIIFLYILDKLPDIIYKLNILSSIINK